MRTTIFSLLLLLLSSCTEFKNRDEIVTLQNPILPGYFADPSIVQHEGKFYMYATVDPWGGDFLACWVSEDFQNWTFHQLNWPTKQACTSPLSNENRVWAPSVIQKGDAFYMYISVGSEVWCGKASHPLGPWENMLGDQPMIPYDTTRYCHVIDAEPFIDDDGRIYLYWGSGWNWINATCFAAELNDDMKSFKTEPVEVTPPNYFEGPLMVKHNSKYYLTYSNGKTVNSTYNVRYAIGDTPFGPFTEAENSPILSSDDSLQVYGPAHHTFFNFKGKDYILYQRHRLPFVPETAYRQIGITEFSFDQNTGLINRISPENTQVFPNLAKKTRNKIEPSCVSSSSEMDEYLKADMTLDNNFITRWEAADNDYSPFLKVDFKPYTHVNEMKVLFEYPWKTYFIKVESSTNDSQWETIADYTDKGISGSPTIISINKKITSVRISFINVQPDTKPSIWDVYFN